MITDKELKDLVLRNPDSIVAAAYRLGRKEANLELAESIKASVPNCLKEILGTMPDEVETK